MVEISYVLFIDEDSYRGDREFMTRKFDTLAEAKAFELGLREGACWDVQACDSFHEGTPCDDNYSFTDHQREFLDMWSERDERGRWVRMSPNDPHQEGAYAPV